MRSIRSVTGAARSLRTASATPEAGPSRQVVSALRRSLASRSNSTLAPQSSIDVSSSSGRAELQPSLRALLKKAEQSYDSVGVAQSTPRNVSFTASVRSLRRHAKVSFLSVSDGSIPGAGVVQAVLRGPVLGQIEETGKVHTGTAVRLSGHFAQSRGRTQALEFVVDEGSVVGPCDVTSHPIFSSRIVAEAAQEQRMSLAASLGRRHPHLRTQEPSFAATVRLRSRLELAMAQWFDSQDFTRTHPPIMTSNDCEGAGKVFRVEESEPRCAAGALEGASAEEIVPKYLTVSSQLHLESLLLGLGRVYTINPAFRAESSDTNRHLQEFWMCEAELPMSGVGDELEELTGVVEDLLKSSASSALGIASPSGEQKDAQALHSAESLQRVGTMLDASRPWPRITYTAVIELMQGLFDEDAARVDGRGSATSVPADTAKMTRRPEWGDSLSSEQEKYLAEVHFGGVPCFVTDYPATIKPFYMRVAEDGRTVRCFDLLVPGLGELVGGSLREDRQKVLHRRMQECGMEASSPDASAGDGQAAQYDNLEWYHTSLRKSGMPPHGGFGIGVERLVMWLANRDSVRDCVAFPRVARRPGAGVRY